VLRVAGAIARADALEAAILEKASGVFVSREGAHS